MLHITDAMIDTAVSPADAQQVLLDAFRSFAAGRASMQERIRTEAGGVKISTMGAVLPDQGYAGAKVYSTIAGQFNFVIQLFSTRDGRPLATLEANAITRLRTAACSVIAARHLARPRVRRLAIFGAGVQGRAHACQFAQAHDLQEIRIVDPFAPADTAAQIEAQCRVPVRMTDAACALADADVVVTASRATEPLFEGAQLPAGCFVAAIGSSLPHTRELDDAALERATRIMVDWGPQTSREAGDLMRAAPGCLHGKLVEFADVVSGKQPGRTGPDDITVYKAVGVGLQDIALAGLAYERIAAAR